MHDPFRYCAYYHRDRSFDVLRRTFILQHNLNEKCKNVCMIHLETVQ